MTLKFTNILILLKICVPVVTSVQNMKFLDFQEIKIYDGSDKTINYYVKTIQKFPKSSKFSKIFNIFQNLQKFPKYLKISKSSTFKHKNFDLKNLNFEESFKKNYVVFCRIKWLFQKNEWNIYENINDFDLFTTTINMWENSQTKLEPDFWLVYLLFLKSKKKYQKISKNFVVYLLAV